MDVIAKSFDKLLLFIFYCSLLGRCEPIEATDITTDVVSRTFKEAVNAVNPTFSQGLVHLDQLSDAVMRYDKLISNGTEALHSSIQRSSRSALDYIVEADRIYGNHLHKSKDLLNEVSRVVSDRGKDLRFHQAHFERLMKELASWQAEAKKLKAEIADLEVRVRSINERLVEVSRANRVNRWPGIASTMISGAWPNVGLLLTERYLQNIKSDLAECQTSANERRQFLRTAENKMTSITGRIRLVKDFIHSTQTGFLNAQSIRDQLQAQYSTFTNVDVQIKNTVTFLTQFNSNLSGMHSKRQLMLALEPLLISTNRLVILMENNSDLVTLLGDKVIGKRLRKHMPEIFSSLYGILYIVRHRSS